MMDNQKIEYYLRRALELAEKSIASGGGPFGAVVVKNGEIISEASNSVTLDCDPTAHAEMNAIRIAGKELETFDLNGCVIFCSSEPCPMCHSAICWANIHSVYFANPKSVADQHGFRDSGILEEISSSAIKRKIPVLHHAVSGADKVFTFWNNKSDKVEY